VCRAVSDGRGLDQLEGIVDDGCYDRPELLPPWRECAPTDLSSICRRPLCDCLLPLLLAGLWHASPGCCSSACALAFASHASPWVSGGPCMAAGGGLARLSALLGGA
jgi:hypothetical protein